MTDENKPAGALAQAPVAVQLTRARSIRDPVLLTPKLTEKIAARMVEGPGTVYMAGAHFGIPKQTVANWLLHGRNGHEEYVMFFDAVQIAREKLKAKLLEKIEAAGVDDSANFRFIIERMFPDEFGNKISLVLESERTSMLDAFDAAVAETLSGDLVGHGLRLRQAFYAKLAAGNEG